MSSDVMNTKEVAKCLDIHEKQVYVLIGAGKIPGSRATGHRIFPQKLIDQRIESSAQNGFVPADISFSHLYDPENGNDNTPYLKYYCPDRKPMVQVFIKTIQSEQFKHRIEKSGLYGFRG